MFLILGLDKRSVNQNGLSQCAWCDPWRPKAPRSPPKRRGNRVSWGGSVCGQCPADHQGSSEWSIALSTSICRRILAFSTPNLSTGSTCFTSV